MPMANNIKQAEKQPKTDRKLVKAYKCGCSTFNMPTSVRHISTNFGIGGLLPAKLWQLFNPIMTYEHGY